MEFADAKSHLRSIFEKKDFNLVDEHLTEMFFRHKARNIGLKLEQHDITAFAANYERLKDFENIPFPCCISSPSYVELLLIDVSDRRFGLRRSVIDEGIIFGSSTSDDLYVEIGQASDLFFDFFTQNEAFSALFLFRPLVFGEEFVSRSDLLRRQRFITARVNNLHASSPTAAYSRAVAIINSCLLTVAYMRNLSFQISEDWPQRPALRRPFRHVERMETGEVPLPLGRYDENAVRLYQRGVGSVDPVVRFLSFYQALEYYFIGVTDADLHNRLASIFNDPAFRPNTKFLGRIVNETLVHRRETDETEMLKLVLRKFVEENEISVFIERYEEFLGERVFTKSHLMFGIDVRINPQSGHICSSVARRIKHIRNALVHSSDRYEGNDRYIPSKQNEGKLDKEVPLVRFLAEKVIIASASRVA